MINRILTDVTADRLPGIEEGIKFDDGSFIKIDQDDGNFTLVVQLPGDDPEPVGAGNFPWMAIAEQERAAGVKETRPSNPRIEEYFATTTYGKHPDSEPWCSAFANFCVTKANIEGTNSALALSWLDWGIDADELEPGCIVILERGSPGHGHVGFYVGSDDEQSIRLLGGNQGNSVNITAFPKARIIGQRIQPAAGAAIPAPQPQPPVQGKLVDALIQVESGGNDNAEGDKHLANHAFGCLQIRLPVCLDVNRRFGTNIAPEQMLGNRTLSIDTFNKYMNIWAIERWIGRAVTDQDRARIWNGGPNGYKRDSTLGYWAKVQQKL